jgi:peptidoglycan/xylan/chitin deacetylase (PgdA/CDA1 family)
MTQPRGPALLGAAILLAACTATSGPTPSAPVQSPTPTPFGTVEPTESASVDPTAAPSLTGTTYTVQVGDTLSSISRAWGTSVAQLQAWNAANYPSLATDPNSVEAGWVLIVADNSETTPLPTVAPTPVPSGCTAGNRVAAGTQQTFTTVPNAGHAVALTLDMGGRLDPGVDILNFLIEKQVCVTLFPTGAMARTPEGQEVMAIIRDHPELFEVGNHTMHHCNLVVGGGGSPSTVPCAGVDPTADFIRSELTDAGTILEQFSGQQPVPYWRPPFGAVNQAVRDAAASVGYTKTFMWDVDTIDWKPVSDGGPTAEQIATKVISRSVDGSIVLMHLGGYETLDALAIMVPGLRDRGLLLTSLSDMLN